MHRITLSKLAAATVSLLLSASVHAQPLKVGVTPGALADSAEIAAEEARQAGLDVDVIEFTDWTTPNRALASGDLDLNYYQHQAFLDTANREGGFELVSIDVGLQGSFGIFSDKYERLEEIPDGARVALANDTSNQARALAALQEAGLIELTADAPRLASLDDIAANPKRLNFVEIQGPQLVRALGDVDVVLTTPGNFVTAGQLDTAASGLHYTANEDSYWAIQFVTRQDNGDDADIRRFIDIYQGSEAVRRQIHESNASNSDFYRLAWLDNGDAE